MYFVTFLIRQASDNMISGFLDSLFHLQIAEMSKNRVLKFLLKRNFEHIYLRARLDNYAPQRMADAADEHHRLVDRMMRGVRGGGDVHAGVAGCGRCSNYFHCGECTV